MSATLKRTPLHETHVAAGARMVDFGGWDMPVNYGSQIEEHHAVRRDAGIFDVSHMLNVDVTGSDATAFLRRLVANDVSKLTQPGKALYSCMLNPQGGVIDDLIVYFCIFSFDYSRKTAKLDFVEVKAEKLITSFRTGCFRHWLFL